MHVITIGQKEKLHTLRVNQYFHGLSEASLKQLAAHMTLRKYERGEALFWEGDPCSGLHIVEKGSIKLFRVSPQGRQYIVRVMQEGDTCRGARLRWRDQSRKRRAFRENAGGGRAVRDRARTFL
jgi:signal-transduction protein with cAMP-binding, CBS, and nucleotidyltransferase domain